MRRIIALGFSALPLAAAAFGGALWLADTFVPAGNSASVEMMQVLHDEHSLVADYVKMDTEAKRRVYAAADEQAAALKIAALEQSRMRTEQGERLAQADIEAKSERKSATAKTAIRIEHVALTQAAPIAAPLPLAQMANASVAAPQVEEGPVRSRLRELASDVRRIPSLLQSAAGWVAGAVPKPKLPLLPLPTRPFTATI